MRDACTYDDGSLRPTYESEVRLYRAQKQTSGQWADLMGAEDCAAGRRERVRQWRRTAATTTTRSGDGTASLPGVVALPRRDDQSDEVHWVPTRWEAMSRGDLASVVATAGHRARAEMRIVEAGQVLTDLLARHPTASHVQEALDLEGVTLDRFLTGGEATA